MGLLLLRTLVGCSLIALGVGYVQMSNHTVGQWCSAAVAFTGGAFLLAGLMTPLVAAIVAVVGVGIALSVIPLPSQALFDGYLTIINLIVLSIAIVLLGPGAFSLDARMFGRREIPIPSSRDVPRA